MPVTHTEFSILTFMVDKGGGKGAGGGGRVKEGAGNWWAAGEVEPSWAEQLEDWEARVMVEQEEVLAKDKGLRYRYRYRNIIILVMYSQRSPAK